MALRNKRKTVPSWIITEEIFVGSKLEKLPHIWFTKTPKKGNLLPKQKVILYTDIFVGFL